MFSQYLALDFETANNTRSSPCGLGYQLTNINGETILENFMYINPEEDFDPHNIAIHGITPEDVADSPPFPAAFQTLSAILTEYPNTLLIAHNSAFDISVYLRSAQRYGLQTPSLNHLCTMRLARCLFPQISHYSLDTLSYDFDLPDFSHHNALSDSKQALALFFAILKEKQYDGLEDLLEKTPFTLGKLEKDRYTLCPWSFNPPKSYLISKLSASDASKFNQENPLYGKITVFTGTLSKYTRVEAAKKVLEVGGLVSDSLTKKANFLVCGTQDAIRLRGNDKSSKMIKAERYAKEGADLQIIDEETFFNLFEY